MQFPFIFRFIKTLRSLKKVTSYIAKEDVNDQTEVYTKSACILHPAPFHEALTKMLLYDFSKKRFE